ncbi:hypothetical protein FS837_012051 [Tulasnella sp. UAMH 9824]|nr:hypothetical protein FS837_012051 [Tulasnella sp. UAMH 9824]
MAARRKAKDEISALIPLLKHGAVGAEGTTVGANVEPAWLMENHYPTLRMEAEDFDEAFEKADSALQSHGTIANVSSCSLRQFRNAQRSPIYRLPLETLTTILILTSGITSAPYKLLDTSKTPVIKAVLNLAHVSSRWYKAVKACPILWTHIVADYAPPLVSMCLERSGNLPLTVTCWGRGKRRRKEFLHELSKYIHRWETADLVITYNDVRRITHQPASRLKALSVVPVAENDAQALLGVPDDLPMAQDLFNGQTPQLEELKIHYWLRWEEANCPRLRKLEIMLLIGRVPSVTDLNDMLSACPLLETFSISAPVQRPDFTLGCIADIKLPHLKSIQIEGFPPLALSTFIVRLDLPAAEIIHIEPNYSLEEEDNETDVTVLMVTMITIKPVLERLSPLATSVYVVLDEDDGVEFTFFGPQPEPGLPSQFREIKLSRFPWTDVMKFAIMKCPAFVGKCTDLNVVGGGGKGCSSTTEQLIDLVTSLHSLESVALSGTPESATLLSNFLDSGRRKQGILSLFRPWKGLYDLTLGGCLCDQKRKIMEVLEKWKDRRRKKLQHREPWINLSNDGCRKCGAVRKKMEKIVDEGDAFPDLDSDSDSDLGSSGEDEDRDETGPD